MRNMFLKEPSSGVALEVPRAAGAEPAFEQRQPHIRPRNPGIQALRAGAVALVVLYHSWPKLVPGGYVGVDVFFVISGFLITRQLLDEAEHTGTISLRQFWTRRARRLLPASLLVLACAAAATFAWAPPSVSPQFFRELTASALYVQNWVLAADSVDYFASTNKASPVQHFWTLSVEEQFYVGLPLILLAALIAARPWTSLVRRRALMASVLALAALGSVAYSLSLTLSSPSVAYFSSGTRAWEFAAGALLTFRARSAPRWLALLGWIAIASAAFTFGGDTHMPGIAAFVPVLGAVAVLLKETGDQRLVSSVEPGRWSGGRAVQWLGNISYSLYLWHWPPLVLAPLAMGRELGDLDKVIVCAVSVALAWGTTCWVEDPIRYGRWPRRRLAPWQVAACSALGMAAIVATARLGITRLDREARESLATAARLFAEGTPCFGAQSSRWGEPCHNEALSGVLLPDVSLVSQDIVRRPECLVEPGGIWRVCSLGPPSGYGERLMAVGDSHMMALLPALEVIASEQGWGIDLACKAGCRWSNAMPGDDSPYNVGCQPWNDEFRAWLREREPYRAILTTQMSGRLPKAAPGEDPRTTLVRGFVEVWKPQAERGTRIIALVDNPRADRTTGSCVERHSLAANQWCLLDRALALSHFNGLLEATRAVPGSTLIDLTERYCDARACYPVIGNVIVYRDNNHITGTYSRTLAPFLLEQIQAALR